MISAPDTPASWARYADLAPLLKGAGIMLSAADYDHAAGCVNAHQALVDALTEVRAAHWRADPHHARDCTVCQMADAALAKAAVAP